MKQKICLTIAGLDPSGGAGIIADIRTFSAFGCFAAAAIASVTFQNTQGVFGAENLSAESVRRQIEPILDDYEIAALKTGMLPTREIIEEIALIISENNLQNFVVDTVVRSTSGFDLIDDKALNSLIEKLFPLATIITPNIPEAERIARMKIESAADIEKAARIMQNFGAENVLIKGGHLPISDSRFKIQDSRFQISEMPVKAGRKAVYYLYLGQSLHIFESEFIETAATHGTGCTLSAAIAANLAHGKNLIESIEIAKKFVTEAIRTAPNLGKGHSPINHLVEIF